jgi:hypothetical protein
VIWATLALLGIPIWFIVVILLAVFRNRKMVRARPDVFRFVERNDDKWARGVGYARWVSDVVIIHKGPGLVGTDARQVLEVEVQEDVAEPPKKLDGGAVEVAWTFADSDPKRVAVAASDVQLARGAGIPDAHDRDTETIEDLPKGEL